MSKAITWKRREHKCMKELRQSKMLKKLKLTFPEHHYTSEAGSIISPSDMTFGSWEVMDIHGEVLRFETLEKSKKHCEKTLEQQAKKLKNA